MNFSTYKKAISIMPDLRFYLLITSICLSFHTNGQLFKLLPPESTNVRFENTITDEKDHNILMYSNYYGGAGVGVGDFNKDGLVDLFFAGNLVSDEIYFNLGDLKFQQTNTESGIMDNGGWSSGVVVADVNNDGWTDIYVTRELYDERPDLRKNLLYINTGKTFDLGKGKTGVRFEEKAAEYGLDNGERTRHAGFLDYDNDGWLDIFLLNQPPNPGNYSDFFGVDLMQEKWSPRLFCNNGNGSFSDVSKQSGVLKPGYANSMVATDVNKDGWTDIYLCNDYEAPDRLYLNQGDGTFEDVLPQQMNHISYYAMGVDAADVNNDGWQDLMTLDMVAEDNFRLKANMSGMNPKSFWKVVENGGHYQYMFNAVHLNNAGKNFSDIAQLTGMSNTDWSWSNLVADFDNDGWKDVFVTNGLLRDIRNSDAAKTFPKYVQSTINEFIKNNPNAGDVHIFDILDLEEALDLLPSVPLKNYAYRNNGDLTFDKKTDEWGLSEKTFSNGSAYADLDNDGDKDMVISQDFRILFLDNLDGKGRFELIFGESTLAQSFSLSAADFDADGFLDVYICGYNPSLSESRAGALGTPIPFHDANNGGANMLWRNIGNWNFKDVAKEVGLDKNNTRFSFAASWEDYDDDGDLDLYVVNDFGRNCLYQNQGTEKGRLPTFKNVAPFLKTEDTSAGMSSNWGDFNRDGKMDLYVSNMFSSAGNRITFQKQFKQGSDDALKAHYQRMARGNSLFLSNGKGGFTDVSIASGTTMARWCWGSTFTDLNNDGWPDILAANGFITAEDTGDL